MFGKKRIYLDVAAGVRGNPSSPHEEGRAAKVRLEAARTRIAQLVEVKPDDVIFTSGATEANALAILGAVRSRQRVVGREKQRHALYLPSSHASVIENMLLLREEGVEVEALPVKNARVDTEALALMLRPETILVSMDAVCGETGVVWNTREVAAVLHKAHGASTSLAPSGPLSLGRPAAAISARPVLLHVDASQAPLTQKITRSHFGADMVTFDALKVSSVRRIGCLIAHRTIPLEPLYRGGGQERGLRPGSEAPHAAEMFAEGLERAGEERESFVARAVADRQVLRETLCQLIPEVLINEGREQAPNILNISLPGRDTDYLVALLDEAGFAVSTKSACETDSGAGSRAVLALTGDTARAESTLRVSWGPTTRARDLVRFAQALAESVKV